MDILFREAVGFLIDAVIVLYANLSLWYWNNHDFFMTIHLLGRNSTL